MRGKGRGRDYVRGERRAGEGGREGENSRRSEVEYGWAGLSVRQYGRETLGQNYLS